MVLGLSGSLAFHIGVLAWIAAATDMPDLGLDLHLPDEVEFGLTEDMAAAESAQAPSTAEPPGPPDIDTEGATPVDAGRRRRDASGPDAGVAESADSGVGDGGDGGPALIAGDGEGTSRLPPGAQIALRMDMARIRRSALAPDVRALLAAIPDWHAVLNGSGIEPVDDLDRVLIASPNLQRSRMVLAGRFEGDGTTVRAVVQRMAQQRGVPAVWQTVDGVDVAPWPNEDETERVIALVGPQHFTITRPDDLARVMAVARARAEREAQRDAGPGAPAPPPGAEALLSMEGEAALTFEVEGARRFARGAEGVPQRARAAVTQRGDGHVSMRIEGTFDSHDQAVEARDFWDRARQAYARNFFVAALGMGSPLRDLTLTVEGDRLIAETSMTIAQVRLVLSYLRDLLVQQARPRAGTAPTPPTAPEGRETPPQETEPRESAP